MPDIYAAAGEHGNLVITAPNPQLLIAPTPGGRPVPPRPARTSPADAPPPVRTNPLGVHDKPRTPAEP